MSAQIASVPRMAIACVDQQMRAPIHRGIRTAIVGAVPALPEKYQPAWSGVTPEQRSTFLATPQGMDLGDEPSDGRVNSAIIRNKLALLWQDHWYLAGAGLAVAIILIYLAGVLLGGFLGRKVYGRLELLIAQVPVFKQVYPHVKQLVDLVIGERQVAFQKAVLFEYPRKGVS